MIVLLIVAGFFALFLVMVWRNLPGPSSEWGQFGLFPTLQGPPLGTPESLEHFDPDAELRRARHREHHNDEQNS